MPLPERVNNVLKAKHIKIKRTILLMKTYKAYLLVHGKITKVMFAITLVRMATDTAGRRGMGGKRDRA